eukprot:TRINITY_DN14962_c0_g4_i1.p1 TRINITY_DN14962_c0_g4~~TRINITY_DN14962_c0_g4_i1.p1  ORF type:complete len:568 (-),score=92.13 TRINITY_DN14962_c0_g4_i1:109-1713(-)
MAVGPMAAGVESGTYPAQGLLSEGPKIPLVSHPSTGVAEEISAEAADVAGVEASAAEDVKATFEQAKRRANLGFAPGWAGALLLANTLLGGSGMLGVPHAFATSGYALGIVLLVLFGFTSAFGCHLLQCSAREIGVAPTSFYVVSNAVTPRWTWLVDGAVMVKCFGVGTSYLIIVGDLAPEAMEALGVHGLARWHVVTVAFAIAASLACFRKLTALTYTALGAVLIVAWTVILIALFYAGVLEPCGASDHSIPCAGAEVRPVPNLHEGGLQSLLALGKSLPVFVFAFTCQQNVFSVANEVRRATRKRMDAIIFVAYVLSGTAFACAALMGYGTYGGGVAADILKQYPAGPAVSVTRVFYSLLAIFSYPMQVHPCRNSALALWGMLARRRATSSHAARAASTAADAVAETATSSAAVGGDAAAPGSGGEAAGTETSAAPAAGSAEGPVPPADSFRYCTVTFVIFCCAYTVAVTMTDLGKILGIVGATGSTTVSYILPGLVYIRTFPDPHWKRAMAKCQLLAGCIIMPTCLALVFL